MYFWNISARVINTMHTSMIIAAPLDTALDPPSLYKKEKKKHK